MPRTTLTYSLALVLSTSAAALASGATAQTAAEATADYDLPAQPLGTSLRAVAVRSGFNILAPASLIGDRQAPALKGRYTAVQAIRLVLAGSGLRARIEGAGIIVEQDIADARAIDPI